MPATTSDSSIQFAQYLVHVPRLTPVPKFVDVFDAPDPRRGSWYVIGSYTSLGRFKPTLFDAASRWMKLGAKKSWDIHHIVEGQHFAEISFHGDDFPRMYKRALPCVLVDSFEHQQYYNDLLHGTETRTLLRLRSGRDSDDRAHRAYLTFRRATATDDRPTLSKLSAKVERMAELYANTYEHAPVLQRIAANVFAATLDLFRR